MSQNNPYAPQENNGQQPANPYGAPPSTGQPDPSVQQGQNGQFGQQPYEQNSYGQQQPYGGAPHYAQQQYTQPYGGAPQATSGLAIASLASGIAGWTILPFIGAIAAIILGHMGLGDVKKNNKSGRGLAITGLVLGYVGLILTILAIVGLMALIQNDAAFLEFTTDSTS